MKLTVYFTEYPTAQFEAENDREALNKTKAKLVYRKPKVTDGVNMHYSFVILRDHYRKEKV